MRKELNETQMNDTNGGCFAGNWDFDFLDIFDFGDDCCCDTPKPKPVDPCKPAKPVCGTKPKPTKPTKPVCGIKPKPTKPAKPVCGDDLFDGDWDMDFDWGLC